MHKEQIKNILDLLSPLVEDSMPRKLDNFNINLNQNLRDDLGFDSMGLMTLAFYIEEEFKFDVAANVESFGDIDIVNDLVKFIFQFTAINT